MAQPLRVLVTGSAGRIGQAVVRELKSRGHFVRGLDLKATRGADDSVMTDLSDAVAVHRAAESMGAIIHLAATPDDDDFLTKLVPNNLIGVYHVLEAARLAGVRRLALASSGQVVWWQRFTGPLPIGANDPPTPRGWYAATKVFQEAAGRAYADSHGISVVAARLGWCPRTREHAEELAATDWGPDVYLSTGDAGRFFALAAEAPLDFRFAVLYACSRPLREAVYDLQTAKERIGYEPRDAWPEGIEDLNRGTPP